MAALTGADALPLIGVGCRGKVNVGRTDMELEKKGTIFQRDEASILAKKKEEERRMMQEYLLK